MLDYSETSENVYLTFNQHIELKNKKFEILVHLTFKNNEINQALLTLETRFPLSCYVLIHNKFRSQWSFFPDVFWGWETRCP